ncbi:hypothetical protein DFS33DRAFT_1342955 [Desarmillaria ectypa]|nr:hypothetical protein DFS33DRAFT_1342955 [Desarmillaria ectypa]
MAIVYMYPVINHRRPIFSCTIPTTILLAFTSASIAQAFFCYQYWMMWMLASLVSAVCMTIFTTEFMLAIPVTTIVICAATDVTITGCLVWACLHKESPFLSTRNLLQRVMIQALTCRFTTAIPTILMTVFLFTIWDAFYTFYATLGRIYSLSLLHRDLSTVRIDGDSVSSGPTVLDSICESMDGQFSGD